MTKIQTTFTAAALLACTALVGTADAATISVTQTKGISTIANGTTSHSEAFDVQNANSVLVVGVYLENSTGSVTGIDFGGQSAEGIISDPRGFLFYFLNPTTPADAIDFTHDGSNGGGIVAWELAGVDLRDAVVTSTTSNSITTTIDNEFVIALGWNNGGLISSTPEGLNTDFSGPDGRSNGMAGVSGTVVSPTTINLAFGAQDTNSPAAISFRPVPEPGSLALLGLGGLLVASRRRRG